MAKRVRTEQEEVEAIRSKLDHYSTEDERGGVKFWMDTGEPFLHRVLGSPTLGLPYGRLYELSGSESQGKTVLALDLLAQAQQEGAKTAWVDFESSWDPRWAGTRGIDVSKLAVVQPYIGKFGKKSKVERLSTAEEICEEVENWIVKKHKDNSDSRIYVGFDSVAAMLVDAEAEAGVTDQNMRSSMALATFLSKILRRWVALARTCNAMLFFINQTREKPMAFGNPTYTPGGRALKFYCSVRAEMRRKSGGQLRSKNGKISGIKGVITNLKNKAGEGSLEKERCGFRIFWDGRSEFVPIEEISEEDT